MRNKEVLRQRMIIFRRNNPWYVTWMNAKQRCNNIKHPMYKYYGGRGIKCLITKDEIKTLWFRDKASLLNFPSINRKYNDGNYEYSNCEFIEWGLNSAERNRRVSSKPILQYDLQNNFIKEWFSASDVEHELKYDQGNISKVCLNQKRTAYGYIWKFNTN